MPDHHEDFSPEEDMDLSEFLEHCDAIQVRPGHWEASLKLNILREQQPDGYPITLNVRGCFSEFEAKERVYLYLKALIYGENE